MVLLALVVVITALLLIFINKNINIGVIISGLLLFSTVIAMAEWSGKNNTELESVKEHQINCINAYQMSEKEDADWVWLVENLNNDNKEIDIIESKTHYLLLDVHMFMSKPDYQSYKIIIDDNSITLPENYDVVVPRNVITRNEKG